MLSHQRWSTLKAPDFVFSDSPSHWGGCENWRGTMTCSRPGDMGFGSLARELWCGSLTKERSGFAQQQQQSNRKVAKSLVGKHAVTGSRPGSHGHS